MMLGQSLTMVWHEDGRDLGTVLGDRGYIRQKYMREHKHAEECAKERIDREARRSEQENGLERYREAWRRNLIDWSYREGVQMYGLESYGRCDCGLDERLDKIIAAVEPVRPGTLIELDTGERILIGHINEGLGECEHCAGHYYNYRDRAARVSYSLIDLATTERSEDDERREID